MLVPRFQPQQLCRPKAIALQAHGQKWAVPVDGYFTLDCPQGDGDSKAALAGASFHQGEKASIQSRRQAKHFGLVIVQAYSIGGVEPKAIGDGRGALLFVQHVQ